MAIQDMAFEAAMTAGLEAHAQGNHREALTYRKQAFFAADNEVNQARALRDGAASLTYLGQLGEAQAAAEISVTLLDTPSPVKRELAASYDRLARVRTLCNMRAERSGDHVFNPARGLYERAFGLLELRDQYRTNLLSRVAVAEALYGTRSLAIMDAVRAIRGALGSEARPKHLKAGLGALAVGVAVKSPHKPRAHTRSFALAERLMR